MGTVVAPLIGLADAVVMGWFGLEAHETPALVWVAGPVEEALKVAPLIVLMRWVVP